MTFRALTIVLVLTLPAASGFPKSFIAEGADLPSFELKTADGGIYSSSRLEKKVGVVAFVRPEQPSSLSALKDVKLVEDRVDPASWERIAIFSGAVDVDAVRSWVRRAQFDGTLLLDPDRKVYLAFEVLALPSVAVFGRDGRIAYSRAGPSKDLASNLELHLRKSLGLPPPPSENGPLAPKSGAALRLAESLLERNDLVRAEAEIRKAIEHEPSARAFALLGEVLVRREAPGEALRILTKAQSTRPDEPLLELARARALSALGRVGEARSVLEQLVLHHPGSWEYHVALAEVHAAAGNDGLALAEYRKAVRLLKKELDRRDR